MAFEDTVWGKVVSASAQYHGVAFRFRGRDFSYDYLKDRVEGFASRLFKLGIRKGDVVAICSPNVPGAVFAMYAANSIGAVNLILHPLLPEAAVEEDLKRTKAKLLLVLDQRYSAYRDIQSCPVYALSVRPELGILESFFYPILYRKKLKGSKKRDFLALPESDDDLPLNENGTELSFLLESGGTTGKSKLVALSDEAINFAGQRVDWILGDQYRYCKGSGMLGFLPMFHGFGLAMGVHAPLINEAVSDIMPVYSDKEVAKLIQERKLRYMIVVPYLANRMMKGKALSAKIVKNLTHAFIGGDTPNPSLFGRFDKRMEEGGSICRLLQGYGLTETVTVVTVNRLFDNRIGSVGKPIPGISLKIVDPQGNEVPAGEKGEVCIAGKALALGYYEDEETTRKAFVVDKEGTRWLKTGDEGYLDSDGFLFLVGRIKDLFKIAGYNVFPLDIESAALSVKGVEDAAAVFVAKDEHPYVHLYLSTDGSLPEAKFRKRVKDVLQATLIRYEVPEKITILESLPRTRIGKIDREALKARKDS